MSNVTPIRIGDLRHRILFQYLERTADDQGGYTEEWKNLKTVWAKVEPVSSKERLYSQRIEYQRSHKITIRNTDGITQEMRIVFDDRYFQIKGIRKIDERNFFMLIDAEENQGS